MLTSDCACISFGCPYRSWLQLAIRIAIRGSHADKRSVDDRECDHRWAAYSDITVTASCTKSVEQDTAKRCVRIQTYLRTMRVETIGCIDHSLGMVDRPAGSASRMTQVNRASQWSRRRWIMVKRVVAKKMLIGLAVATFCAVPLGASAHDHWGHGDRNQHAWRHGDWHRDRSDWHRDDDRWRRGDDGDGGRWMAGAMVAGALEGLVDSSVPPAHRYYEAPPRVVYRRPDRVIYENAPVVTRTIVYGAPYGPRYDDDDGD